MNFVRGFGDYHHKRGIGATLKQRGYCGHWGPGFAMLMLYETTKDKRYLELAEEVSVFMMKKAERTADGGLSHFNGKPHLWVDTLDMCCPVFSNLARITKRSELQAEAVRQIEVFARHLQDPKTGLFYHMWDEKSGKRTPSFWARGNGWVVMAFTEVLKNDKAGLLAITEWLGHCPWTERMLGILDDLWKHAPVETRFGRIASLDTEVNGEMLQVLCRMYWMTGKKQYLEYACRIGDYYLLGENHTEFLPGEGYLESCTGTMTGPPLEARPWTSARNQNNVETGLCKPDFR